MHSTESCLYLGLPNILSSVLNPIFYAFVTTAPFSATMSSFDQCRNVWSRHETNELYNFNSFPITSCI